MLKHNIVVVKMPAHLTHLLQPLDLKVFSAYKNYHRQHVNEAATLGFDHYDKTEFLNDLTSIRKKTFKAKTIASAWKAAGIIPWDPDYVIRKMMQTDAQPSAVPIPTTPTRSRTADVIKPPQPFAHYSELVRS